MKATTDKSIVCGHTRQLQQDDDKDNSNDNDKDGNDDDGDSDDDGAEKELDDAAKEVCVCVANRMKNIFLISCHQYQMKCYSAQAEALHFPFFNLPPFSSFSAPPSLPL